MRSHVAQYIQWVKTTGKAEATSSDGKPKHLRTVTADVEKEQAVVEAFRVSPFSGCSRPEERFRPTLT